MYHKHLYSGSQKAQPYRLEFDATQAQVSVHEPQLKNLTVEQNRSIRGLTTQHLLRSPLRKPLLALSAALLSTSALAQSNPRHTPAAQQTPAQLPVTHVSLYKNGVGFFEHAGRVSGNQTVTIDFTSAQLNDVLQSLTAIDLGGGRIAGAGYNSTTPLEQQLKLLPLALGEAPTSVDVFNAIRGARVDVHSPSGSLSGRILSFEIRTSANDDATKTPTLEKHFLTVAAESGDIRTFELTPVTTVRLLDTPLRLDLSRYLQLLDTNRSQTIRHLNLLDKGTGLRDLRVSYLAEVPIWKSTYRILFTDSPSASSASSAKDQSATLQGWSVVDNTTGADWINVQLSLIAGSPQSFIQPLSQPIYTRRPEIPIAQDAQLTPQTHDSAIDSLKQDGAPPPAVAGAASMGSGFGLGPGSGGNTGSGVYSIGGPVDAARSRKMRGGGGINGSTTSVSVAPEPLIAYETSAADSFSPSTTTTASFDDFFAYNLTDPVTIRKNESALVPILQTAIQSERVTLWSPQQTQPLRALWITNTSPLTLDRGSFTIVENGSFGGQGLLDPIHPGERRLLSYAADQAVRVSTDQSSSTRKVQSISVSRGVLKEETAEIAEVEYLVHNAAPDPRTVIVEQPIRQGWHLDNATGKIGQDPKPDETTSTVYRFRVSTAPRQTVRLHIGERHTLNQFFRLTDSSEAQILLLLRNDNASPDLLARLEPVFSAKRQVASLDGQIDAKTQALNRIVEDQKRLRDNLAALKGGNEERTLARRYTAELNQQEDTLASLRRDLATLEQQRSTAQANLSSEIESLNINETL